jgi:hypothetical protein
MEKENIQKLQKLSNEQQELIENNIDEIKKILYTVFKHDKRIKNPHEKVYEVISHLPEVTMEYNKDKHPNVPYHKFAANRCILRSIDDYRTFSKVYNKYVKNNKNYPKSLKTKHQFSDVDWDDLKKHVSHLKDDIFKKVIEEYIIPNAENPKCPVTMENIAHKYDVSIARICQIVHSKKIKDIIENAIGSIR